MAEIIRFDNEKFLKLYKTPAEDSERTKYIFKALEIRDRVKEKEKEKENVK